MRVATGLQFGGADLLVNNAGVMLPAPIEQLRADQWRHQIDLNITGLMNIIGSHPATCGRTIGFLATLPPRVNLQQITIMPTGQTT